MALYYAAIKEQKNMLTCLGGFCDNCCFYNICIMTNNRPIKKHNNNQKAIIILIIILIIAEIIFIGVNI